LVTKLSEVTLANYAAFLPGATLAGTTISYGSSTGSQALQHLGVRFTGPDAFGFGRTIKVLLPNAVPMGNKKLFLGRQPENVLDVELQGLCPNEIKNNLAVNGTFDSDTVWNKGAGWTIAGGVAVATAAASDLDQTSLFEPRVFYHVEFTVSGYSSGTITPVLGGTVGTPRGADGTFKEALKAGTSDSLLKFTGAGPFTGDIEMAEKTQFALQRTRVDGRRRFRKEDRRGRDDVKNRFRISRKIHGSSYRILSQARSRKRVDPGQRNAIPALEAGRVDDRSFDPFDVKRHGVGDALDQSTKEPDGIAIVFEMALAEWGLPPDWILDNWSRRKLDVMLDAMQYRLSKMHGTEEKKPPEVIVPDDMNTPEARERAAKFRLEKAFGNAAQIEGF
jgi:hypothetical protein